MLKLFNLNNSLNRESINLKWKKPFSDNNAIINKINNHIKLVDINSVTKCIQQNLFINQYWLNRKIHFLLN